MFRLSRASLVGVSGMSVFAPPARVDLKEWCGWTGNNWSKVSSVVGNSFRVPTANENTYTMAATAALRLILQNDVDPRSIGFLGLGTESSTDNSAGAIIVRGMVDMALQDLGKPRLSRYLEVPEFKHACLGGIYALKSAGRYVASDGLSDQKHAIVVASDIAEYAQGSTGEQTQGAGAVAMLVENNARLFDMNLVDSGSASAYRGPDFRKPFKRHFMEGYDKSEHGKIPDFPVFSGPYSTMAYLDEVTMAVEEMLRKLNVRPGDFYDSVSALFFHRPYQAMPVQAMSFLYARGLARAHSDRHKSEFLSLCEKAKVKPEAVHAELDNSPDFYEAIARGETPVDTSKATGAVAKVVRSNPVFMDLLERKMSMGGNYMANFGNLYTASLPCWLAAGFEEAYEQDLDIGGRPMIMVGYGSGDASESIPIKPARDWKKQAAKIGIKEALANPLDLTHEQYKGLHAGSIKDDIAADRRKGTFTITRIGQRNEPAFQDIGVEYCGYHK